jgi:D-alanine-D-alanine ligase
MTRKLRVGVIFGGRSGEHEVSLRSAHSVLEALDRTKYEVVPIAITKEGKWVGPAEAMALLPERSRQLLSEGTMTKASQSVTLVGNPAFPGFISQRRDAERADSKLLDVVFPVLHGTYGEDGTIQGWLEMAGLPYVGCGVLASSSGMDKVTMKALFHEAGLPICRHIWFLRSEWERAPEKVAHRVKRRIGFPCFVKPANLGSSVGISKADDKESLRRAVELAARYDRKIIIEEALDAREIECAVMGNDEPQSSLPGEYIVKEPSATFLDYTEKYSNTGHVEFVVPAPLKKAITTQIQKLAARAFQSLDCAGLARVDFFLRRDTDELLVNELNTMPGLTDVSGFPKMWQASGFTFPQIIDRLIELALERYQERSRNQTSL